MPSAQYHPCYSGLQVQGTANTPAARVLILHGFSENVNAFGGRKKISGQYSDGACRRGPNIIFYEMVEKEYVKC